MKHFIAKINEDGNKAVDPMSEGGCTCPFCTKTVQYKSYFSLVRHVGVSHFLDEICKFNEGTPEQVYLQTEMQKHPCKMCSLAFNDQTKLEHHMLSIHFKNKVAGKVANVSIDGEILFCCPECSRQDNILMDMARHYFSHHCDKEAMITEYILAETEQLANVDDAEKIKAAEFSACQDEEQPELAVFELPKLVHHDDHPVPTNNKAKKPKKRTDTWKRTQSKLNRQSGKTYNNYKGVLVNGRKNHVDSSAIQR